MIQNKKYKYYKNKSFILYINEELNLTIYLKIFKY